MDASTGHGNTTCLKEFSIPLSVMPQQHMLIALTEHIVDPSSAIAEGRMKAYRVSKGADHRQMQRCCPISI